MSMTHSNGTRTQFPHVRDPHLNNDFRKRKHDDLDDESQTGDSITIHAHPSLTAGKPQKLIPIFLLPRSCLPLSYIDSFDDCEGSAFSKMFSAHIKILEYDAEHRQNLFSKVLIVEDDAHTRLYAIERAQIGVYALCRLFQWVSISILEKLQDTALACVPTLGKVHQDPPGNLVGEWWRDATVQPDPGYQVAQRDIPPASARIRRTRLWLRRPFQYDSPSPRTRPILQTSATEQLECIPDVRVDKVSQKPEDVFKLVKSQYQEALYVSRASLAYYAKGPLSRARAIFHLHDGSTYDCSHLVQFLRSIVLSLPLMDKKYRETLPMLVQDLPFSMLSDDESASVIAVIGKKSRRSKKEKLGKDGLYPGEDISIAQWWLGRDTSDLASDAADARETSVKITLLEQRARETQLQIILVLEILALEGTVVESVESNIKEVALADIAETQLDTSLRKTKRPKKPQDLHTLLDLLVDRLCIWQSTSSEVEMTSPSERGSSSHQGRKANDASSNSDHLRQFCVDVVLPFYGARLPNLSTLLCQKLGGPKQPSPKRAPFVKSANILQASSRKAPPVQRPQVNKPRRTLERVLTDEKSFIRKPTPSLSRSATEPVLPQLKREVSDTSLSAIPLNRVALSKRYSQREVDLRAAAQANEAKIKKKAAVEQELQSAIAALKKPNPRMAAKDFMEAAEKRVAGPQSRKSKNPVRNPFAQSVQVMATPSKNRQTDIFAGLPRLARACQAATAIQELEEVPPSSISRIPSSTLKAQGSSVIDHSTSRNKGPFAQTPTKCPSKFFERHSSSVNLKSPQPRYSSQLEVGEAHEASLPVYALPVCHIALHETPSGKGVSYQSLDTEEPSVQATPSKKPPPSWEIGGSPVRSTPLTSLQDNETAIYTRLGWDNDIDEII